MPYDQVSARGEQVTCHLALSRVGQKAVLVAPMYGHDDCIRLGACDPDHILGLLYIVDRHPRA